MPRAGDVLALSHQLYEDNSSQFVRAIMKKANGVALPSSPVTLNYVGNGKYATSSVLMPADTAYVEVTYEVYQSVSLPLVESPLYSFGTDTFELSVPDFLIYQKLIDIENKLTGIQGGPSQIEAVIGDVKNLRAYIEKTQNIVAEIRENKISGTLEQDDVTGTIEEQSV